MIYCARGHKQPGTYQGDSESDRCKVCGLWDFPTRHDAMEYANNQLDDKRKDGSHE